MKIVYIHESIAHKGGLERIFVDKMNYLADRLQYEVYLLTASQGNTPVSFPLSPRVRHFDLGVRFHSQYQYRYPKRLWEAKKLDNLLKERAQMMIDNIHPDFIICTTAWLLGTVFLFFTAYLVPRDIAVLRGQMRARALEERKLHEAAGVEKPVE